MRLKYMAIGKDNKDVDFGAKDLVFMVHGIKANLFNVGKTAIVKTRP